MSYWLSVLSLLAAILLGLFFWWQGRRLYARSGLPRGSVIYADTSEWERQQEPLISRKYGIVGKPDYLVVVIEKGSEHHIPVEVKSRSSPPEPYESHVMQLGAYCLIVEDVFKQRPPYGLLRYADQTFKIPFTTGLRTQVIEAANAIRGHRLAASVQRQHRDPGRCQGCGYRQGCGHESLV